MWLHSSDGRMVCPGTHVTHFALDVVPDLKSLGWIYMMKPALLLFNHRLAGPFALPVGFVLAAVSGGQNGR